jgi:hypothetical protein
MRESVLPYEAGNSGEIASFPPGPPRGDLAGVQIHPARLPAPHARDGTIVFLYDLAAIQSDHVDLLDLDQAGNQVRAEVYGGGTLARQVLAAGHGKLQ